MGRWSRGFCVVLMGGILLNGGCATAPSCPVPQSVPAAVSHPLPASSSSSGGLEQKVKLQEKRIADPSMQLKLLKQIDLDRTKP